MTLHMHYGLTENPGVFLNLSGTNLASETWPPHEAVHNVVSFPVSIFSVCHLREGSSEQAIYPLAIGGIVLGIAMKVSPKSG